MQVAKINYNNSNAPADFTRSIKETGFGILDNHPIPIKLIDNIYKEWESFFSSDSKHEYLFNEKEQDGYFPLGTENAKGYKAKDHKEFYHYYPWGRIPKNITNDTIELYNILVDITSTLLEWIDINTPAKTRTNFHEPLKSMITLLVAGTKPGLEAKATNGVWHKISTDPGTIIVNAGDMLKEVSAGYYPSTTHRVVNPEKKSNNSRYSMPLFLHPRNEVILSDKYTAGQYLEERLKEIGLKE